LRAGGVVALPTETVYGLAADITHESAIERVYAIKGRPRDHPLIVHVGSVREMEQYAVAVPPAAHRLAARFWPGPLTIVLRKSPQVPDVVTAGQPTVALRMVDHPLTLAILRVFGGAVAAPSANRFGRVSPTSAEHVRDDLGDDVDYIVDGGPCRVGVESTIVDLSGEVPAILRVGAVGPSALASALGTPVVVRSGGPVRVPGSLASHYAPRAELVLVDAAAVDAEVERRVAAGERVAKLTLPEDPAAAARSLYASLRALDAEGNHAIVTALPPDDELHAAVRDRLARAAAPRPTTTEAS
jgi:L-threonylcarbamoyladenylate synthase